MVEGARAEGAMEVGEGGDKMACLRWLLYPNEVPKVTERVTV